MEVQAISGSSPAHLTVQQPTTSADTVQAQEATIIIPEAAAKPATTDQVNLTSSVTIKNLDTVRAIEQMHSRMNQLVKGVRETNEAINKAVEQVSNLQTNANLIAKNFPPFPVESKERQELLMSYASIRQELMRMTVPQPPAPVYEQVKQLWDTTMGENGQMMAGAVPALDTASSDAQVKTAANQLESTNNDLANLSSGVTQALIGG